MKNHQAYASTNVRKNLDTTKRNPDLMKFGCSVLMTAAGCRSAAFGHGPAMENAPLGAAVIKD
jgi:hypothetical protein